MKVFCSVDFKNKFYIKLLFVQIVDESFELYLWSKFNKNIVNVSSKILRLKIEGRFESHWFLQCHKNHQQMWVLMGIL